MANEHRVSFPRVIEHQGQQWQLNPGVVTSDGYVIAWGEQLDEDGEPNGVGHSFFLGSAS